LRTEALIDKLATISNEICLCSTASFPMHRNWSPLPYGCSSARACKTLSRSLSARQQAVGPFFNKLLGSGDSFETRVAYVLAHRRRAKLQTDKIGERAACIASAHVGETHQADALDAQKYYGPRRERLF